ncbi:MAG: transglycosylase SLT domain-containing protein [Desulfovermiculus sp.]
MHRRQVLAALAAAGLSGLYPGQSQAGWAESSPSVGIIQPRSRTIPRSEQERKKYEYRLWRAVLDLIEEWYGQGNLPVWRRPLAEIDMKKRVINIAYWVMRSIPQEEDVYPVDPAWIMAQIMEESFFYEFAVSWAFAVGICQFMSATARSVGMVCPENSLLDPGELERPDLALSLTQLQELQKERRKLVSSDPTLFQDPQAKLKEVLSALAAGEGYPRSDSDLSRLEEAERLDTQIADARSSYRRFLQANYEGRSIFDSRDLHFFKRFDQRVTYKKPVQGMVRIMAENLRARGGNLLAATAAYNAGLSRTHTSRNGYESYGQMPAFQETVAYLSRIVVNHHEIARRI